MIICLNLKNLFLLVKTHKEQTLDAHILIHSCPIMGKCVFFCDQEQKIYHHAKFHKKSEIVGFMLHFLGSIDLE